MIQYIGAVILTFHLVFSKTLFSRENMVERVVTEQQKFAKNLESLQLKKLPHRIYIAGEDIMEGLHLTDKNKNSIDMKFAYELVKPSACELLEPTYGCCWDNKTAAMGVNGKGCPVCQDSKRSCRRWKEYCHDVTVREVCPESCNACPRKPDNCQDEEDQKEFCPMYAKVGLCKRKQIRLHCKNTCNACGET